jgi:hypothetical protein
MVAEHALQSFLTSSLGRKYSARVLINMKYALKGTTPDQDRANNGGLLTAFLVSVICAAVLLHLNHVNNQSKAGKDKPTYKLEDGRADTDGR